jgi:O-antigen/teichoic acid export membrane protein
VPLGDEGPSPSSALAGLGRSIAWSYAGLATSAVSGLIVTAYALRRVGAEVFGVFALATTVLALFTTLDFGLSLAVVRATARDRDDDGASQSSHRTIEVAHAAYVALAAATVVFGGAFAVIAPRLFPSSAVAGTGPRLMLLFVTLAVAVNLGTSALTGMATGRRQFRLLAVAAAASASVTFAIVVAFLGSVGVSVLGLADLGGALVGAGVVWAWAHTREVWFSLWPVRPSRAELRNVATFALPLLLLTASSQIVFSTDLIVVGAVATAATVAFYKVGTLIPNQAITGLYAGYDTVFPGLAGSRDDGHQVEVTAFLTAVMAFIAGAGFGALALLRTSIATLLVGHPSSFTSSVIAVFCAVWLVNVPAHGLALLLLAKGEQRRLTPVIIIEAAANLVLTVTFAVAFGPLGAAVATLVTYTVANLVLVPLVARSQVQGSFSVLIRSGIGPAVAGLVVAGAVLAPTASLPVGAERLGVGLPSVVIVASTVGILLLGRSGRSQLGVMLRRSAPLP